MENNIGENFSNDFEFSFLDSTDNDDDEQNPFNTGPITKAKENIKNPEFLSLPIKWSSFYINREDFDLQPKDYWEGQKYSLNLDDLKRIFSIKGKNIGSFTTKLYNCLEITKKRGDLFEYIGVKFIQNEYILVDTTIFGSLLNYKDNRSSKSLVHQGGNFCMLGFQVVYDVPENFPLVKTKISDPLYLLKLEGFNMNTRFEDYPKRSNKNL